MLGSFLDDLLVRAVRALSRAGVEYTLIGGTALLLSGRDRNTRDVDVITVMTSDQIAQLVQATHGEGFRHRPDKDVFRLQDVTIYRFSFFLEDLGISMSLDVQLGHTRYHAEVLQRAQDLQIAGLRLRVATHEDLLLLKLLAFRPIDRADCLHLLRLYPDMDRAYLLSWIEKLQVSARWDEVLALNAEGL